MEGRGKEYRWKTVPQFGDWDKKGAASPNYSMVFSQARAHRKQAKKGVRLLSLEKEADIRAKQNLYFHHHRDRHEDDHPDNSTNMKKDKFMTYCCIRPF